MQHQLGEETASHAPRPASKFKKDYYGGALLIAVSARGDKSGGDAGEEAASHGHPGGMPDLRGGICIILGILAFLLFGEYGGLLPATFAIVFISALGDRDNTLTEALLLSLAMCFIAVVVFWWALKLQLPLFQWGG